jgi:hypothetical protein
MRSERKSLEGLNSLFLEREQCIFSSTIKEFYSCCFFFSKALEALEFYPNDGFLDQVKFSQDLLATYELL